MSSVILENAVLDPQDSIGFLDDIQAVCNRQRCDSGFFSDSHQTLLDLLLRFNIQCIGPFIE